MNSKAKGNQAEREIETLIRGLHSPAITAQRNRQGLQAALMGEGGFRTGEGNPDILLTIGGHEIHLESKRTERLRLNDAMKQAEHDANGRIPAVAHRGNRQPWRITLNLMDLLDLCDDLIDER